MQGPDGEHFLAPTSDHPYGIHLEKAEGSYIWDKNGKKYLDFIAGIAVANLGHRHPEVLKAIDAQSSKYLHTMVYGEYYQDAQMDLGKLLSQILPENLNCTYLVNSGTEANEAALKLAKRHTSRRKIISMNKSYHGSSHGSLSVSGNESKKAAFRPLLPEVYFMEFNKYEDLDIIDEETACVITEVVQGDAGVRIGEEEYLRQLRKKCDDVGALLIFDEIQSGMGRTGKFFAFEHSGVFPDILTLAKGLGGGLPIGAMISSVEIMKDFTHEPMLGHITTFGGNPMSCATSIATIREILKMSLEEIEEKGRYLSESLSHPKIMDKRQIGLMLAVDLSSEQELSDLIERCREKGLIIYRFLSHPYSFRISPALNIRNEDLKIGSEIILSCLDEMD